MRTVNVDEAQTNLSRLIEEAMNGEPFIIASAGKPMVQVTAVAPHHPVKKQLGFLAHLGPIPDDFDDMFAEDIVAMFEGAYGTTEQNNHEKS